jgi:DNA polymerase III epsilon subunit-like protein
MNQTIKSLEYSKLLFVDIETVAGCNNFDENHPQYDIWAWKQRNKETNEILTAEENIKLYNTKAALFAEWGKIVCISVGFVHNEELHIKSFVGEEKQMLIDFIDLVKSTGRMIAGHNIIGFDINFIRKRFFINGLTDYLSDKQGNDVYMKPWLLDQSLFDTMVAWKGSGFANTSLEELTMVFGIPTSKDNCHGNEVTEFYYSGRIKEIQSYCEKDVASVANLVRVWKGDSILEPIIRQDVQVEELPLLQRIYKATNIDSATKEKIQEKLSKAKPTRKDREILYDILTSLYINNAMFSSDKEDVKEQKRKEIKELLNVK